MTLWQLSVFPALAALLCAPCAHAQDERPLPPIATVPPPASASSQIELNVLVLDSAGNPVSGLQQSDFSLLDEKQLQPVEGFRPPAAAGETPTEAVVVIDAVNTAFTNVSYEREEIDKFLKANGGKLPVPVSLAIFTDQGISISPSASQDGNVLAADLDGKQTGLRTLRRSMGFYGAIDRLGVSLHAMSNLADYERKRPGHKLVIWVSPGWPYLTSPRINYTNREQQSLFHSIADLSAALREAHITLYSIDPLGAQDAASFRSFYYQEFLKPVRKESQALPGDLALQVLAVNSGGRPVRGTNDIAGAIRSCLGEANEFYALRFAGANPEPVAAYHSIQVKLNKPGLTARTRTGYYAVLPATPDQK